MIRSQKVFWVSLLTMVLCLGFVLGFVGSATAADEKDYPSKPVMVISPSKPGSGFDTTARAVVAALTKEKLVPVALPVTNLSGSAPGTAHIVTRYKNNPYMIGVQSVAGMMNYATKMSPYSHKDYVPIARLISAYYGIFVRDDSPYKTLDDLLKDLKDNPGATPLSGGTSDDRVFYGALFSKVGIDITKINYAAYSGGTLASTVVLEGTAKAEVTTIDDIMGLIEAKKLRPLAVSSEKRLPGVLSNTPTLKEAGVDFSWENFRYMLGGPGMPDYAKKYWQKTLAKMVETPAWQDLLKKYRWGNSFMVEGFDAFLDEKQAVITDVMTKLGMTQEKK